MRLAATAALLSLSACCVIVVETSGNGEDAGNPFQQQQQQFPPDATFVQPVAVCRAVPTDAGVGELVTFDGSGSQPSPGASQIVSWSWDFGDGSQGTGTIAAHAYGNAGLFISTLTVADDQGLTSQNSCPAVSVHP